MADIPDAGLSVVVVGEAEATADAARDEIMAYCKAQRDEWAYRHEDLTAAVARAKGANDFPVICSTTPTMSVPAAPRTR